MNFVSFKSQCFPQLCLQKHWDYRETKLTVPLGTSHYVLNITSSLTGTFETPIYWLAPNENSFIAHLKESATYIGSKFHSTDLFVYPILIMWWYPRENLLSNLDIFMPACSLFNEHDKGSNRVCIVTWSVLRKQKWQAKKFYSWIIVLAR